LARATTVAELDADQPERIRAELDALVQRPPVPPTGAVLWSPSQRSNASIVATAPRQMVVAESLTRCLAEGMTGSGLVADVWRRPARQRGARRRHRVRSEHLTTRRMT